MNQIRPIELRRKNWLVAGSLRAGKRAAAVMSLIHSARLNGHEVHAYMKDVLERLPSQPANRIEELLPHCWMPVHDLTFIDSYLSMWDRRVLTFHLRMNLVLISIDASDQVPGKSLV